MQRYEAGKGNVAEPVMKRELREFSGWKGAICEASEDRSRLRPF